MYRHQHRIWQKVTDSRTSRCRAIARQGEALHGRKAAVGMKDTDGGIIVKSMPTLNRDGIRAKEWTKWTVHGVRLYPWKMVPLLFTDSEGKYSVHGIFQNPCYQTFWPCRATVLNWPKQRKCRRSQVWLKVWWIASKCRFCDNRWDWQKAMINPSCLH